jgi:hypothetical protein
MVIEEFLTSKQDLDSNFYTTTSDEPFFNLRVDDLVIDPWALYSVENFGSSLKSSGPQGVKTWIVS